jgi:uncharacterized membrane protein
MKPISNQPMNDPMSNESISNPATPNRFLSGHGYYLAAAAIIAATVIGIAVAYPQLPASVPTHWNANGQVNGWSPKWTLFLWGPGLMSLMVAVFAAIPWLSPKKFEVDSFRTTYLYIMIVIVAMIAYAHILIVVSGLGVPFDMTRAIEGCVCVLTMLLGNVLGKLRRNFFMGIRTPWTLANERVWNATHRFGAKTFFAAGLAGLVAAILRAPFWLPIAAIVAGALVPAIYSLTFYKQLERRGEL